MKRALLIILGLTIIGGGGFFLYQMTSDDNPKPARSSDTTKAAEVTKPASEPEKQAQSAFNFSIPKKSAHYVSNTPEHGSILMAVPSEVVINFNFDLSNISTISVKKDDKEYGVGAISFSADNLTMRRAVAADAGSGQYKVNYNACWPDGSCHDGHFEFGVQ